MKRLLLLFSMVYFLPQTALALKYEDGADAPTRGMEDFIKDYVDVAKDGLDWKILGKTKIINIDTKDKDGMDLVYQKPDFPSEVKKLDKTKIRIKGYMFPLGPEEHQTEFLFGPFPLNCPFQYHVSPAFVIEVHGATDFPIKFSYDPMTIEGTLELVPDDKEFSTFFRLNAAKLIKE